MHRGLHLGDFVFRGLAARVHRFDPAHHPATLIYLLKTLLYWFRWALEFLDPLFWPGIIQPQCDVVGMR